MSEEGSNSSGDSEASEFFFILLEELFDCCNSDSLSEEGIRQIIEQLTPNDHVCVDDYGFFMAACWNERVTEGIIRCLLEYFPEASSYVDTTAVQAGCLPLHFACYNKSMTLNIIHLLIDAAPESVSRVDHHGWTPLHILCRNRELDEEAAIEILKLLIEKCPEAARHADNDGCLPIHFACMYRSCEFCRVLLEAHPGSEQITDGSGELPLHRACSKWAFATVKYLYNLFPNAIHHASTDGYCPIHTAIIGKSSNNVDTAIAAVAIVKFLLDCDPNVKFQRCEGIRLLDFACDTGLNHSNDVQWVCVAVEIVKAVYDAHPEAIYDNRIVSRMHNSYLRTQSFIHGELRYACQPKITE